MLKIFDDDCICIFPAKDGFVAVFSRDGDDGPVLGYRYVSVREDTAKEIDFNRFKDLKFGHDYEILKLHIDDCLLALYKPCENGKKLVVTGDGAAKLIGPNGTVLLRSDFRYGVCVPADIAAGDGVVWATYPEKNSCIRYNLSTLRQELRIGGQNGKVLRSPNGMLLREGQLYICNSGENKILLLDTVNFTVREYLKFDEPVYQYVQVEGFHIVRLRSGVYRI